MENKELGQVFKFIIIPVDGHIVLDMVHHFDQ